MYTIYEGIVPSIHIEHICLHAVCLVYCDRVVSHCTCAVSQIHMAALSLPLMSSSQTPLFRLPALLFYPTRCL